MSSVIDPMPAEMPRRRCVGEGCEGVLARPLAVLGGRADRAVFGCPKCRLLQIRVYSRAEMDVALRRALAAAAT